MKSKQNDINKYNNIIRSTKYYSIDEAIKSPIKSNKVFIIANEHLTKTKKIGRYFTVFPSFKNFLKHRDEYPHCHELIIDHNNNKLDPSGRLVFDFDIKFDAFDFKITDATLKLQIEHIIFDVIETYFVDVNPHIIEYIWSSSENNTKISKHLTIKNFFFDDWITLSKIFYELFSILWDEKYTWISAANLVDAQIIKKRTSLRMVGSCKIGGSVMILDNPCHKFTDSLIRIYDKSIDTEQKITIKNISKYVFKNVLSKNKILKSKKNTMNTFKEINSPYTKEIYIKAFELCNIIIKDVFKMHKSNGKILNLTRLRPYKCLLSGIVHDHENAFCIIYDNDPNFYNILYGCYRFCYIKKTKYIGSIRKDDLVIIINPNINLFKKNHKYLSSESDS